MNSTVKNEFRIKSENDFTALRDFIDTGLTPLNTPGDVRETAVSVALEWLIPWALNYIDVGDDASQFTCLIEQQLSGWTVRVILTKHSVTWGKGSPLSDLMNSTPRARLFNIIMSGNQSPDRAITLAVSLDK